MTLQLEAYEIVDALTKQTCNETDLQMVVWIRHQTSESSACRCHQADQPCLLGLLRIFLTRTHAHTHAL